MAAIDQDNFSNISWHSEQNAAATGSSTSPVTESASMEYSKSVPAVNTDVGEQEDDLSPGHHGEILECTVSDPHKEGDGTKDAYVSYLITTNVGSQPRTPTTGSVSHRLCQLR